MNFLKYITQPLSLIILIVGILLIIWGLLDYQEADIALYTGIIVLSVLLVASLIRTLKQ